MSETHGPGDERKNIGNRPTIGTERRNIITLLTDAMKSPYAIWVSSGSISDVVAEGASNTVELQYN
jgi:hypothetical protein